MTRIPTETEVRATHARSAQLGAHAWRARCRRAARIADSHGVWPAEEVPEHEWQRCSCGTLVYVVCAACGPVHDGCTAQVEVRPA
jgi:hypothetical protein